MLHVSPGQVFTGSKDNADRMRTGPTETDTRDKTADMTYPFCPEGGASHQIQNTTINLSFVTFNEGNKSGPNVSSLGKDSI